MLIIRPLPPDQKKFFSTIVVGIATCPQCKRDDIKVVNDCGEAGDKVYHYLENHYPKESNNLCVCSEKFLRDM